MIKKIVTLFALSTAILSQTYALDVNFDTPGELSKKFLLRSNAEKNFFQSQSNGLSNSGSVSLPYSKQTNIYATTREAINTWVEGKSILVTSYFKTQMPDYTRTNRRALSLGLTTENPLEPKPKTLQDPVYAFGPSVSAGIYTKSFDKTTGTIEVAFHGTSSQPDKPFALTNTTVQLKADHWYYMETRFTATAGQVAVEIALGEMDDQGILIAKLFETKFNTTDVGFEENAPLRAFIGSRDPDLSGVKYIDTFSAK